MAQRWKRLMCAEELLCSSRQVGDLVFGICSHVDEYICLFDSQPHHMRQAQQLWPAWCIYVQLASYAPFGAGMSKIANAGIMRIVTTMQQDICIHQALTESMREIRTHMTNKIDDRTLECIQPWPTSHVSVTSWSKG